MLYALHSFPKPSPHRPYFTSLSCCPFTSLLSLRLLSGLGLSLSCGLVMLESPRINRMQSHAFNVPSNCNQSTPSSSGSMTDLLRGSVGDTRLSDAGYHSGRSALSSDFYMNDRSSTFQTQHELSTQSSSLWTPFEQRSDTSLRHPDSFSHDMSGSGLSRTQVSINSISAQSHSTDTLSTRECSDRPPIKI